MSDFRNFGRDAAFLLPPSVDDWIGEVAAWEENRNTHHAKADWQFTISGARIELKRLYPQFQ
jgi:hypothetical protein